ncbi:YqgE/AlgH family protein [Mariniblastus fucicola]|nr:YqgE/AlgH family protein [Mariniblastus fucicola]
MGFAHGRTVVLVLQDSDEGIFGVVLNRPATPDMLLAWQQLADQPTFAAERLVSGGPVQGPVLALHSKQELAEVEIQGGLFVSVQQNAIERLSELELSEENSAFRIVLGAVNWESGKLQHELDQGSWFVVDGDPSLVFSDPTKLWERSVRQYGADSIRSLTGISQFPADPLLN